MSVKNAVAEWVATRKGDDGFRAAEIAMDIDTNIANVRSALTTLKDEGVVESVKWGVYRAASEQPVVADNVAALAAETGPDPLHLAKESLTRSLEAIRFEMSKIDARITELDAERDEILARSAELTAETQRIEAAYEALVG